MLTAFVETLKTEFHDRLFTKTGWGCHQVWAAFQDALSAALTKTGDQLIAEEESLYGKGEKKKKI